MRDRDKGLVYKLTEDCYIDHIQSPIWCFFCFSAGGYSTHPQWCPGQLLFCVDCPSHWKLTDSSTYGYRCIYTFITPTHSGYPSRCQLMWPASAVLLFTQQEHPIFEIPNWRVCQRSICNNFKVSVKHFRHYATGTLPTYIK